MRQIQFQPGDPTQPLTCAQVEDPTISRPTDVLVRVDRFPINPADLLTVQGLYSRPDNSAPTLGSEATGIVEATGDSVDRVAPGDRVLLLGADVWRELIVTNQADVVRLAPSTPADTAAMLKVNPATAALLLDEFVELAPGDWVIQNAANSAVGTAVHQIAHHRGLNVVNVARRPEVVDELASRGTVLLDDDDLHDTVTQATGGTPVRLALDAVMGASGSRLAGIVANGGSVVAYGAMSGRPMTVEPGALVFRGVHVQGFWLSRWLMKSGVAQRDALYTQLEDLATNLDLTPPVAATFDADDVAAAATQAAQPGLGGKVTVRF